MKASPGLGVFIRTRRIQIDLSLEDFAERMGKPGGHSHFSQRERMPWRWTKDELTRAAKVLGCDLGVLLKMHEAELARKHGQEVEPDTHTPSIRAGRTDESEDVASAWGQRERWYPVVGESMSPAFDEGDKVRLVPVPSPSELTPGQYVVVHFSGTKRDGSALFEWWGNGDKIELRKRNTRFKREDFVGGLDDVVAVYKVAEVKRGGA